MHNEDVSLKGILIFLGILAVTLAVFYLALIVMAHHLEADAQRRDRAAERLGESPSVDSSRPYFPYPREQVTPRVDLEVLRAREDAELNSYGWIDKTAGVVRIPIERAMELVAQRQEGHQ